MTKLCLDPKTCLTIAISLLAVMAGIGGAPVSASDDQREYLVGICYFAGWWREPPNKWAPHGRDWRLDYPERVPVLGEYNEQATMDREIVAAAEHGVDFFQILYYPQEDVRAEPQQAMLNEGLRTFLASPNNRRMRFTIEYVCHAPFEIKTDEDWDAACREWCAAMTHPSYLRVDGRPVFKIHSTYYFHLQNDKDMAKVEARLDAFRRIAREIGLPDPIIGAGTSGVGGLETGPIVAPYDFLTTYMDMPNLPKTDELYPYESLFDHAQKGCIRYATRSEKPYVPYVPAGWDPRPWGDPRPSFAAPTSDEWASALKRTKVALDRFPKLGIPTSNGDRQKAFIIYAWNEFGEGGFVAPTRGEGTMKLDVIREVFGPQAASR